MNANVAKIGMLACADVPGTRIEAGQANPATA
jgi:hypothetical protein